MKYVQTIKLIVLLSFLCFPGVCLPMDNPGNEEHIFKKPKKSVPKKAGVVRTPPQDKSSPHFFNPISQKSHQDGENPFSAASTMTGTVAPKSKKIRPSFADEGMDEAAAVNALKQKLNYIQCLLKEGTDFLKPNWNIVYQSGKRFAALQYQEATWKAYGQTLPNLQRWPFQTSWKQMVGGELFFLQQVQQVENDANKDYIQSRNDTLWALGFASKYQHSLAQAYLFRAVVQIRNASSFINPFPVEDLLLDRALKSLRQAPETPDVCYAIAMLYWENDTKCRQLMGEELNDKGEYRGVLEYNGARSLVWLEKMGQDPRAVFRKIFLQAYLENHSASAQDYIPLARQGYGPAYCEVMKRQKEQLRCVDPQKPPVQDAVLNTLFAQGSAQGILNARLEQAVRLSDAQLRHQMCTILGSQGFPEAYIRLGESAIDDICTPNLHDPKKVEAATMAFTFAGKAGHPRGLRNLIKVYEAQHKGTEEQFGSRLFKGAALELMQLGLNRSGCPPFNTETKNMLETYQDLKKGHYFQYHLVHMISDLLDEDNHP